MSRRAAVLGSPIAHSLSPVLHRTAYDVLGLDWRYDAIEVTEAELPAFLEGLGDDWAGLSLTMPLKTAVLPLLDEMTQTVEITGAANTVVLTDGRRMGDNTDVAGMVQSLRTAAGPAWAPVNATVLGGGATARSAVAALARLGVAEIDVAVRSVARQDDLRRVAEPLGVTLTFVPWDDASVALERDAVISTVPFGAADQLSGAIPPAPGALLDVAYGSTVPALTHAWRAAGGATADGLDLLLWQAVDQVRLMTGRSAPVEDMATALRASVVGSAE